MYILLIEGGIVGFLQNDKFNLMKTFNVVTQKATFHMCSKI